MVTKADTHIKELRTCFAEWGFVESQNFSLRCLSRQISF